MRIYEVKYAIEYWMDGEPAGDDTIAIKVAAPSISIAMGKVEAHVKKSSHNFQPYKAKEGGAAHTCQDKGFEIRSCSIIAESDI